MSYNANDYSPSPAWAPPVPPAPCNTPTPEFLATLLGMEPEKASSLLANLTGGTGAIAPLRNASLIQLQQHLSPTRAAKLLAAIELGRRLFALPPTSPKTIDGPEAAAAVLAYHLGFQSVEKACVLVLDLKHRLLHTEVFSIGTISQYLLCPRDVFSIVLRVNGARCIIAHNHPSANDSMGTLPSDEDIKLTSELLQAGKAMYIPVLDHLVIGNGCFTSIRQYKPELWTQYPQGD